MSQWWLGLSARERILILVAGGLALLVGLYQFAYKPLSNAYDSAELAYKRQALETYQTLEGLERLREIDNAGQTGQLGQNESLELLLSRTSKENELAIRRLQPSANDSTMVWLDSADPVLVNRWIFELENRYGLSIVALDLRRQPGSPLLRGSVTVRRGARS